MSLASEQQPVTAQAGLLKRAGMDRAVGLTVAGRMIQGGAQFINLLLVARLLTAQEQGYYVAFGSLLALQVIFQLGLSQVILHAASHEVAHLHLGSSGAYEGDEPSLRRLADLLQVSAKWYVAMAALLIGALVPVGLAFFASDPSSKVVAWRLPWVLAAVFTAGTMVSTAATCFVEGCGEVTDVAALRLSSTVVGSLVSWALLFAHQGLYCVAGFSACQFVVAAGWLTNRHGRKLAPLLRMSDVKGALNWRKTLWPFQRQMAISFLAGYLVFQVFNPILFKYHGPVVEGQFGLTLAALTGVSQISMAWITTKVPLFGTLIAKRQFSELDAVFFRNAKQVVALCAMLSMAFWAVVDLLRRVVPSLGSRFADDRTTAVLVVATVFVAATFAMASYLRSHKQEPFLGLSLVVGVANVFVALLLGRPFGAFGIAMGYLVTTALVGFGWGAHIFQTKRVAWHT